MIQRNCYSRV